MKVYCEDCKYEHLFVGWADLHSEHCCNYEKGVITSPRYKSIDYAVYDIDNKNNNCPYYKEKWCKKLWGIFNCQYYKEKWYKKLWRLFK